MKKHNNSSVDDTWPQKAYKNLAFLTSSDARPIRVLCEFTEPDSRFERFKVRDTIVFFGSARIKSAEDAQNNLKRVKAELSGEDDGDELERRIKCAERDLSMSRYYEDARQLAHRLTEWTNTLPNNGNRFAICSGGGPGIMEAANRGAIEAGGPSIGLNISLPQEQEPNPYQTRELSFEFHYFFIRKFWFAYLARAMVVFPGGFGTLDELFEVLTLIQTRKTEKKIPIVVFGTDYWKKVVNFEALAEMGMINHEDLSLFKHFDDVDSAMEFLKEALTRNHLGDLTR